MEWESYSPCCSHIYPGQGLRSFRRCSGYKLEFRGCGTIPEQELLLTAERWIKGMWGRRLWWEMPVEESQAAMEARQNCWVMHRGWSHHHSLSLPTCQHRQLNNSLAHQTPDALNYRVGPHPGWPFKWLMHQSTEKDPRQRSLLSAWMGRAMEKDWPKRPSDRQLPEAQKKRLW